MKRRNFLRLAALTPLSAAAPARAFAAIKRTGGPFIKPTLNAYSFLEQLNENMKDASKGIDLFGVVDFCAHHNIEAVDLTGYFFPGYPKAPAETKVARRSSHELKLTSKLGAPPVADSYALGRRATATVMVTTAQTGTFYVGLLVRLAGNPNTGDTYALSLTNSTTDTKNGFNFGVTGLPSSGAYGYYFIGKGTSGGLNGGVRTSEPPYVGCYD